ncbi:MAG TPA: hypothetical protein VF247_08355 [Candidatus Krumholzibacteria bacterium]
MIAGLAAAPALLAPPVLEPFDGGTHTSSYLVEGTVDTLRLDSKVLILRNDVVIDSAATVKTKSFSVRIPLLPGKNTITAVRVAVIDSVLQVSPPSNAVHVNFVETETFFIPVPFPPGGSFDLNPGREASGATLRVYDMVGDEVARFENRTPRSYYSFIWDGLNGGSEAVRRGPLIAVAVIDYPDGTHDVRRRAFLFDPGASR